MGSCIHKYFPSLFIYSGFQNFILYEIYRLDRFILICKSNILLLLLLLLMAWDWFHLSFSKVIPKRYNEIIFLNRTIKENKKRKKANVLTAYRGPLQCHKSTSYIKISINGMSLRWFYSMLFVLLILKVECKSHPCTYSLAFVVCEYWQTAERQRG